MRENVFTEAVGRIADRTVQIFGGAGYMVEYPVERIYPDVRLMRIYEGTTQIQQLIIAREVLKRYGALVRHCCNGHSRMTPSVLRECGRPGF